MSGRGRRRGTALPISRMGVKLPTDKPKEAFVWDESKGIE
jgi:hypothetical protein